MTMHVDPAPNTVAKPNAEMGSFFDGYAGDWDAFYSVQSVSGRAFDYLNRRRRAVELVERRVIAGGEVLEFGCGAGHTAVELARRGYAMTCIDVSANMVEATRRTFAQAGRQARIRQGTIVDAIEPPESFDAVMAMGVMEYVPDHDAAVRRMFELLKPGGVCLLSFSNGDSPLFWVEQPLKFVIGGTLFALTRNARFRDIAFTKSYRHRRSYVEQLLRRGGFVVEPFTYFTFGIRLSSWWFPPLGLVRRWDERLSTGPLRTWCRNFIAVASKPR